MMITNAEKRWEGRERTVRERRRVRETAKTKAHCTFLGELLTMVVDSMKTGKNTSCAI